MWWWLGLKVLRIESANKTAQRNMRSSGRAELMKDPLHKSVSCQRESICVWSHPTMHLTRTEIESRLWPPDRDVPSALVYYPYYCASFFPKNLFFFFSLFAFSVGFRIFGEFSSAHFILNWTMKRSGREKGGNESITNCNKKVRGNCAGFFVVEYVL